ncbi:multi-sensor signal transduction histidine kinase [Dolichospermum compactum NIES-806]|uniref:Multi-sensor signal transduction histidine kinase n=1 Tax=Dolichospermum compactum NIES-806 TaxID=1973481 RepID=A0A1Z4UY74_9CYAN|nr:hypothetical protein [Dolichospermum compactum]BAZ84197.1 multi-sensor signal transduction histidine kinase [Dolichospermum compactum NIES-806]
MDRFTPFHILAQEMIEFIVRVRESGSDIDFVTEETEQVVRQLRQATSTARRSSKVKSQKSKRIYNELSSSLEWSIYFRRPVLVNYKKD